MKIKKTSKLLTLLAATTLAMGTLTACAGLGSNLDPRLPKVTGEYPKEPTIAKGEGEKPKELVTGVLKEGKGEKCGTDSSVMVRYKGQLWEGKEFDSSFSRGKDPVVFPLDKVVKGWQDGLKDALPGSRMELVIPPDLAYKDVEQNGIPKNSTLVFVVDVLACSREKDRAKAMENLKKATEVKAKLPEGLKVEGKLGEKVTITADENFKSNEFQRIVLAEGKGRKLEGDDYPIYHMTHYMGGQQASSYDVLKAPELLNLNVSQTERELKDLTIGSRVLIIQPGTEENSAPAVMVIDIADALSSKQ